MPLYQNSSVTSTKLVLGNYVIQTAASAAATYVNMGAGIITAFGHNITKFDVQAGNAPDPIEGIAAETFTITGELIEYDGSVLSVMQCGAVSESNTSVLSTLVGGGNQTLTPRAFKLTNTTEYSGASKQTIITVFKGTLDTGLQFTAKSDNDTNPIQVMPFTITAKVDATLTAGQQLFSITKTLP